MYLCNVNKKQIIIRTPAATGNSGNKIMTTTINPKDNSTIVRLLNGEQVDIKEVPTFTSFDEAKPYIIECGKQARSMANESESFFLNMAMKEVENAWYKALKADCGYMVYNAACLAFGWLQKMYTFKTTGRVAL